MDASSSHGGGKPPTLMALPAEIRSMIYRAAIPTDQQIETLASPPLLRVNKQIRAEATHLYYSMNTFWIHLPASEDRWPGVLAMFHAAVERGYLASISYIHVIFEIKVKQAEPTEEDDDEDDDEDDVQDDDEDDVQDDVQDDVEDDVQDDVQDDVEDDKWKTAFLALEMSDGYPDFLDDKSPMEEPYLETYVGNNETDWNDYDAVKALVRETLRLDPYFDPDRYVEAYFVWLHFIEF
ncbi:hypothetical protein UCRPA7_4248 [Phaeoacremonium minimum UCRPA7]|uniref:F-box domain-containing protein n=1 Tax=Phaeoacremonium minimum (strain UCR-PA7) TaxID=1286976 RepID=R8BLM1_PHAM7|nr:hypothetical protein UCRPA7_4248 [Phaeoacremonium minimum UCRPA7]EOO00276.1 hypothetical protein UCRPA7_4248 [Phaeoacremonium minimum UCRPA7]